MKDILQIKSVMTAFPYAVDSGQTLKEAQSMMKEHQIRHLPVRSEGDLIGIISDRELELSIERFQGGLVNPEPRVQDIALSHFFAVDLATPVAEVAEQMAEQRLGSALVTKSGKLAGIFTVTDACRCLAKILKGEDPYNEDPSLKKTVNS